MYIELTMHNVQVDYTTESHLLEFPVLKHKRLTNELRATTAHLVVTLSVLASPNSNNVSSYNVTILEDVP